MESTVIRLLVLANIVIAVSWGAPTNAAGQARPVEVGMRSGYALPVGELSDFLEAGPTTWINGRYWLNDRIAVRAEVGRSLLPGNAVVRESPQHRFEEETDVLHVVGGTDFEVMSGEGDGSAVRLNARLSGGRTTYFHDVERGLCLPQQACPPPRVTLLRSSWSVGLGGTVSYEIREGASVSATADWMRAFQVQDDVVSSAFFGDANARTEGFKNPTVVSFTVGLSLGL